MKKNYLLTSSVTILASTLKPLSRLLIICDGTSFFSSSFNPLDVSLSLTSSSASSASSKKIHDAKEN